MAEFDAWYAQNPSAPIPAHLQAAARQRATSSGVYGKAPAKPAAPKPAGTGLPTAQTSAEAIIRTQMTALGLGALGTWAWNAYKNGMPVEQIFLEMRQRPEYKARFPGMTALAKQGRAISEAEYIDLERTYVEIYRRGGLPSGFYDSPDDFGKLIAGNVSPAELSSRVEFATAAVYQTDTAARNALKQYYGIGQGDLVAYWLDPNKALPLLAVRKQAGDIGGAATRTGFGGVSMAEAESLARIGVDANRATEGFGLLYQNRELMGDLPGGADEPTIGRTQQLNAAFRGNARAQEAIEKKRSRRIAEFSGGGQYAESKEGFGGLGSASN
jgi:hypothetical protein